MTSAKRKSYFTNDDLAALQVAFDLACAELRLGRAALAAREQLGALLFQIAANGETDPRQLRRRAVDCFREPAHVVPPEVHPASLLTLAQVFSRGQFRHR